MSSHTISNCERVSDMLGGILQPQNYNQNRAEFTRNQSPDPYSTDAPKQAGPGYQNDTRLVPASKEADKDYGLKNDGTPCQTCKNRKYQDGSDDPGVSFKSPTKVDSKAAAAAVKGHEMEHVFREKNKAQSEGRKVVSQNVAIHTNICPECGKVYVSGGTTRTVTKGVAESSPNDKANGRGQNLNAQA